MDFAVLPPEVNSGRMYTGAGSGPMLAAAAAWDGLATDLGSAAGSYKSVVSGLTGGPWLGPASLAMAAAAAPYAAWLSTTAEQAAQTAMQARSAAMAYEEAFAATVPPPVIAQNRSLLMTLVATNILGQNTAAIAATETHYAEMWAQDAAAMYSYAGGSAAASTLTPFTAPAQNTNPAGAGAQAGAVSQATGTATATRGSSIVSQMVSTVPNVLQGLSSGGGLSGQTGLGSLLNGSTSSISSILGGGSALGNGADLLNFGSGWTFIASGVLFVLGPMLVGPIAAGLPVSELGASSAVGLLGSDTPAVPGLGGGAGVPVSLGRTGGVLAGAGRAASIGGLSVPQAWGVTPAAISRAATGLAGPALAGLPEAELAGMSPGFGGGMLPGSMMAAAAGGGGAAGGSWAAQRGSGTAQPGAATAQQGAGAAQPASSTRTPYGPRSTVLPPVAREASPLRGTDGQPTWPDQRAQSGESPSNDNLRGEINELRKQIADLAMERDLLMRSAALWAKQAMEQ
jgi:PPE-repeat protein